MIYYYLLVKSIHSPLHLIVRVNLSLTVYMVGHFLTRTITPEKLQNIWPLLVLYYWLQYVSYVMLLYAIFIDM